MFTLSLGVDARKTAHLGTHYTPVRAISSTLSLGYEPAAIAVAAFGFALVLLAAELCRRADRRARAAASGVAGPPSFVSAILPGGITAFLVLALVDRWLQT
jgi:hypothetical protein